MTTTRSALGRAGRCHVWVCQNTGICQMKPAEMRLVL